MNPRRAILPLLLTLIAAAPVPTIKIADKDRSLVPSQAQLDKAEKTVKELFATDLAKRNASDKIELANKLLPLALETHDDPAARFVLLNQSINLAASANDPALALQALDRMKSDFVIDAPATADQLLSQLRATTAAQAVAAAKACLLAADWAVQSENAPLADKFIQQARQFADKSIDRELIQQALAKEIRVKALLTLIENSEKARKTLLTDPNDPASNETVGQYLCLVKNNFPQGLPLLAKSNSPLANLARQDLAQPAKPAEQFELANAWWTQADKESDLVRRNLQQRAADWYVKAAQKLDGLNHETALKRVNDAQNTLATGLSLSPGLNVEIFQTETFEKSVKKRINAAIDYDNAVKPDPDLPKDHYSIRYAGYILLPATGKYDFTLIANDGARVFLEDQKALDDPKLAAQRNGARFTVDAEIRKITLRVEYFNATGVGRCRLLWKSPLTGKDEIVPFLYH